MVNTIGLISSLLDVAMVQDVPFCQPQQLQCMHYGITFVLLCVPFLSSTTTLIFVVTLDDFSTAGLSIISVVTGLLLICCIKTIKIL